MKQGRHTRYGAGEAGYCPDAAACDMLQVMKRILALLLAALLMPCCGKNSEAQSPNESGQSSASQGVQPNIASSQDNRREFKLWFNDDKLTPTDIREVAENYARFLGVSKSSNGFFVLAKKNLWHAVGQFGGEEMLNEISNNVTEDVAKIFQRILGYSIIEPALSGSEQPIITFYDPLSDLLLFTQWNTEGRLIGIRFLTGNHLLSKDGFDPMGDFPEIKNVVDTAAAVFRRVQSKIWENYPMLGLKSTAILPSRMDSQKLEVSVFKFRQRVASLSKTYLADKQMQATLDAFVKAFAVGSEERMTPFISDTSSLTAKVLEKFPVVIRQNVQAFYSDANGGLMFASTDFPSLWYVAKFTEDKKKLTIFDVYNMSNPFEPK